MSWLQDRERLQVDAEKFDKSIKLVTKDNFVSRAIAWLLFVLSFGKFKRERFLVNFATTLGNYIFIPKEWSVRSVEILMPHEARHVKQFRWLGLCIHPLVGLPLAAVVFLLLPLPFLLAFGRFYMELDADVAKWKYLIKSNIWGPENIRLHAARRGKSVASVNYFWTLPETWAVKLYKKRAEKVIQWTVSS